MLSTAPRSSFNEKWPYRSAMRTIVAGLQPAILATFAIGILAFSIRDTAECLRSWKRHTNAGMSFSFFTLSFSGLFSLRIFPALSFSFPFGSFLNEPECKKRQQCNCNPEEKADLLQGVYACDGRGQFVPRPTLRVVVNHRQIGAKYHELPN